LQAKIAKFDLYKFYMPGNRPRIGNRMEGAVVLIDELAYTQNRCSPNTRNVGSSEIKLKLDVWFDKHYVFRSVVGDENGKRQGIEIDIVIRLVSKLFKHLVFYSSNVKNFHFLNSIPIEHKQQRRVRVVLQDSFSANETLNIVVEFHYINFNMYEITIVTAMGHDDFRMSDGQYAIELISESASKLKVFTKKTLNDICICED
jgi:hypothetical protein